MATHSNDLVTVELNTQLIPNAEILELKSKLKLVSAQTTDILAAYQKDPDGFLENNDETSLEAVIKDAGSITSIKSTIENKRKEISKFFNDSRDLLLKQYTDILGESNLDTLAANAATLKEIKDGLKFKRMEQRWADLEGTFLASLSHYNIIEDLTPELTDFNTFKLRNPSLVNGAKTRKPSKRAAETQIRETIADWAEALEAYQSNGHALSPKYMMKLLSEFKLNPSSELIFTRSPELKQEENLEEIERKNREAAARLAEEQRRKQQEELARQQEELRKKQEEARILAEKQHIEAQKLKDAQAKAEAEAKARAEQLKAEALRKEQEDLKARQEALEKTLANIPASAMDTKYPTYMKELRASNTSAVLHGSDRNKARALWTLFHNMTEKDSAIYKDTQGDPTQVLELVRYILDL